MEKSNLFAYLRKSFYDENVGFTKLNKTQVKMTFSIVAFRQINTYVYNTKLTLRRYWLKKKEKKKKEAFSHLWNLIVKKKKFKTGLMTSYILLLKL